MARRDGHLIPEYSHTTFQGLLGDLSSDAPVPSGGSAAAVAGSVAAALVAKVARRSRGHRDDADAVVAEAERQRDQLLGLVTVDAASVAEALEARRTGRDVEAATAAAAGPPAAIAERAAIVAHLAAGVAEAGNPALRQDALTALRLGVAITDAAGDLALTDDAEGRNAERARTAMTSAHGAAQRVSATAA
jgi:formiminotetrahydrofolate cyclodeaminase